MILEHSASPGKKVSITLIALAFSGIYWFGLRDDPKVTILNEAIQKNGSSALRDYPYQFQVVRVENTVAVMATPRSTTVPVYRMIGALYPSLAGKAPNDPDFIAAEKELAKVQTEAKKIVLEQPGVSEAKWELDQNWLIGKNISLN